MAKFITIGYGDTAGYESTAEAVRSAAHEHDARLVASGAVMGIAGCAGPGPQPRRCRHHDGAGPYLRSDLPIAGFALIEADDLQQAIELVSATPCAVAQGVVEVWPLQDSAR